MSATHESFRPTSKIRAGSERAFGLVFAGVFAIVGLAPMLDGDAARLWALGVAAVFAASALLAPRLLRPLNLVWFRFGLLLNTVVSPLVFGVLFLFAILPTALAMRALGKDPLRLRRDPAAASYWIRRDPPGPAPESMKNQF